jgi:hypothetical protein
MRGMHSEVTTTVHPHRMEVPRPEIRDELMAGVAEGPRDAAVGSILERRVHVPDAIALIFPIHLFYLDPVGPDPTGAIAPEQHGVVVALGLPGDPRTYNIISDPMCLDQGQTDSILGVDGTTA